MLVSFNALHCIICTTECKKEGNSLVKSVYVVWSYLFFRNRWLRC